MAACTVPSLWKSGVPAGWRFQNHTRRHVTVRGGGSGGGALGKGGGTAVLVSGYFSFRLRMDGVSSAVVSGPCFWS